MADIRVERRGGARVWQWVLLALVVLALALFLLYQAGYIEIPFAISVVELEHGAPVQLVTADAFSLQEA